jgi:hypothetical protein
MDTQAAQVAVRGSVRSRLPAAGAPHFWQEIPGFELLSLLEESPAEEIQHLSQATPSCQDSTSSPQTWQSNG